jgi:hypothetical protein
VAKYIIVLKPMTAEAVKTACSSAMTASAGTGLTMDLGLRRQGDKPADLLLGRTGPQERRGPVQPRRPADREPARRGNLQGAPRLEVPEREARPRPLDSVRLGHMIY